MIRLKAYLQGQQKSLELMRIFLKLLQRLNQDLIRMLYQDVARRGLCSLCHLHQKAMGLLIRLMQNRIYMQGHSCYQILGGSLAGDSKTVDGASTTDFSVAQNVIEPDIEIKKSTLGTSAEAGKLIGTISANNDDRLSVGLYNVVTDNDSDVIKNMDVGRKLPDNGMAENSTGYIYSGKELSYDAMTANVNFLNNASYDSVYKNDPQSIYQAQASVISPLVLKLLDL